MDIKNLEEKWSLLAVDNPGYRSLRIDSSCIPDLFIGVYNSATRCLILKLPDGYGVEFQSTEKANLSIDYFPDTNWIVLKLLDGQFTDLFNDLILSIYNKVCYRNEAKVYSEELITTFYKWSEFFNDKDTMRLSEETIRGIFGELIVLREYILSTAASELNEMLAAWRGPYNNRHDFIFKDKDLEVKTKEDLAIDVHISSEYQLAQDGDKALELAVVSILRDAAGLSIRDLLLSVRELVVGRLGDFTLMLRSLATFGLRFRMLDEYDTYRYVALRIDVYDCAAPGFPKIVYAGLHPGLSQVSYYLRVTGLATFLKSSKKL